MDKTIKVEKIFNDVSRFKPLHHKDERGFFSEIFREDIFAEINFGNNYIQDNFSFSKKKNTIRGLHFQNKPHVQKKIINVISGKIWDVFIDLRKESPNFKMFSFVEHSENDGWLFIPDGYAHGFCTLEDKTSLIYKVDNYYKPDLDGGINFLDPYFDIPWPINLNKAIVSEKDKSLPFFSKLEDQIDFDFKGY